MSRHAAGRARLALTCLLASAAGCVPAELARTRAPRVVLVSIDTLHVEWTGPYNPRVSHTPFLDAFAAEGVRFERAYTEVPITLPAHASLLTGMTARTLGVLRNGDALPETATTIAEILAGEGYRTAGFVSLGVLRPSFGLEQGFEDYPDPFALDATRWYRTADEVLAPATSWIRDHAEEPFFLWVHFSDPHEPYLAVGAPPDTELLVDGEPRGRFNLESAELQRIQLELSPGRHRLRWRSLRTPRPEDRPETAIVLDLLAPRGPEEPVPLAPDYAMDVDVAEGTGALEVKFTGYLERPTPADVLPSYESEVAYVDRHLAKLDDVLRGLGLREDTLVLVVSDHGEGLFRQDLLGHATAVYEDQLRVVWLMRGPDVPRGLVVEDPPAHLVDVAPTVLDLLGLSADMEGRSRAGCFTGGVCPEAEPWWAFALDHRASRLTAMAGYRWPYKWIWKRARPRSGYQVARDPWERENLLLDPGPDNPDPLKHAAESFREVHRELSGVLRSGRGATAENEDLLRSLGYLGGKR